MGLPKWTNPKNWKTPDKDTFKDAWEDSIGGSLQRNIAGLFNGDDNEREGKKLADRIRTSGEPVKTEIKNVISTQLNDVPVFNPSESPYTALVQDGTKNLNEKLPQQGLTPAFFNTREVTAGNIGENNALSFISSRPGGNLNPVSGNTIKFNFVNQETSLKSGMNAMDKRIFSRLKQSTRDSLAARGLNSSAAGAKIEGEVSGDFMDRISAREFDRSMAIDRARRERSGLLFSQQAQAESANLARGSRVFSQNLAKDQADLSRRSLLFNQQMNVDETNLKKQMVSFDQAIKSEGLRMNEANMLFSQKMQVDMKRFGEETALFDMQKSAVELAMKQEGIDYNRELVEFTTNMSASGVPLDRAMRFVGLIQNGEIGAATQVMNGIGLDQSLQNQLFGLLGQAGFTAATYGS